MSTLTSAEERALTWVRDHSVRFPTVGPGSTGLRIAEIHFMNWVLCRVGKYSSNLGRRGRSTFADVLHASRVLNRGLDHMGEVVVHLQRNNPNFASGLDSPDLRSADAGTTLSFADQGRSNYEGGAQKFYPHNVTASDPFVYFAEEMDSRLETARTRLLDYHSSIADLAERVAVDNPDSSTYANIRTQIDRVKSFHDAVNDYEWLLGVVPGTLGQVLRNNQFVGRVREAVTHPSLGTAFQAADFIATLDSAGRLAVQVQAAAGPTSGASRDFIQRSATLLGVLRVACSFLPILGDFYAQMFDGIPGLIAAFRRAVDRKIERINAALPPNYTRGIHGRAVRRPVPPARQRCSRCSREVVRPCRQSLSS